MNIQPQYVLKTPLPFDEINLIIPAGTMVTPQRLTQFPDGEIRSLDCASEYGNLTIWNPRAFNVECPSFENYLKGVAV